MADFKDLFQEADWKQEKHVPVIQAPDKIEKGKIASIEVVVGKEIPHPNTAEHHISWVEVYFLADGEKFPCQIARAEFLSHGSSSAGPNTGTVYTSPAAVFNFKTDKSGIIFASSYCNIHGLWKGAKEIKTE